MKITEEELTKSLERTRKGCSLANVLPETVDYIKGAKEDGLIMGDLDKLEDAYNKGDIDTVRDIALRLIKEKENGKS